MKILDRECICCQIRMQDSCDSAVRTVSRDWQKGGKGKVQMLLRQCNSCP